MSNHLQKMVAANSIANALMKLAERAEKHELELNNGAIVGALLTSFAADLQTTFKLPVL